MPGDQEGPKTEPGAIEPGAVEPGAIQASDGEREAACAALRTAAGEGRLTFEELADRIDAALRSRTRGELAQLTRDLPADTALAAATGQEVAAPPASGSSVFGDVRRSGMWRVPPRSNWSTVFGDVVLDLREASIAESPVRIDARTFFGDIVLLVPDGVAVDLGVTSLLGSVSQHADAADAAAPRVIVTGRTVFGDVKVLHRRLRERLADRLLGQRRGPG